MNTLLIFYPFFIIILIIFFFFLSFKIGLVDKPSSRKIHEGNIPLIGGITGCLSIFIFSYIVIDDNILLSIILISSLIFLVGILDDIFDIHFSYRLVLQFVIILIAIGYGFSIKELGYYNLTGKLNLGLFGILLTFLSISGLTNSLNFLDGIDGLCAGSVLVSFASIFFFGLVFNSEVNWLFFYFVILFLIIFLLFNVFSFINFKIFLGDSGSTFFGFLLSLSLIYFTSESQNYFHPALAIWCVSLPIFDLINVIMNRILSKTNPFLPDRTHIHHLLINYGINHTYIFIILILLQIIFAISGLLSFLFLGPDFSIIFFIFLYFLYFLYNLRLRKYSL